MNTLLVLLLLVAVIGAICAYIASRPVGRQLTALGNAVGDGVRFTHNGDHPVLLEAAVARPHLLLRKGTGDNQALLGTNAARPFGVAQGGGEIGDTVAMHRLGMGGRSVLGLASGAIAADSRLSPDASGKIRALPVAAGTYWVIGTSVTSAAGDNDEFEFVSCVPFQVVVT